VLDGESGNTAHTPQSVWSRSGLGSNRAPLVTARAQWLQPHKAQYDVSCHVTCHGQTKQLYVSMLTVHSIAEWKQLCFVFKSKFSLGVFHKEDFAMNFNSISRNKNGAQNRDRQGTDLLKM
jgi:hypothetical protein